MAQVIDYDYIEEISTLDAGRNLASDTTNGYTQDLPGVNTFLINAEAQAYNFPEGEGGLGIAGWSTDAKWTAGVGSISWTSGNINLPDGTQISISSGSASVSAPTYIYVDMEDGTVYSTTTATSAVGENKIMICAAFPNTNKNVTFKAFGCADQNSLTTGSDIASGTITANNIASNTITASQIASGTITANEIASNTITASEIASGAVTASKIDVSELSAITANMGDVHVGTTTSGSSNKSGIRIYPSSSNGYMTFYYNKNQVGEIAGGYNNLSGHNVIQISGDYIQLAGDVFNYNNVFFGGKLRIPVGSNLYN